MITLKSDLDAISDILRQTFAMEPFKRNYDMTLARIASILHRHGIDDTNPRNLRFSFILCMQEFFDGIPQDHWRVKDPAFVRQSEEFAIAKFREWIIEQVT
ncbi:MAG: hypothetical protein ABI347_11460 [Nitrososphaera sp.]|jgi:hypothetical protein